MTISQRGIELIRCFEALRLTPYKDAGGLWTVGWGHLLLPGEPRVRITKAQAERYFLYDVTSAVRSVTTFCNVLPLNQNQMDALTSLVFNIGRDNFRKSTMRKLINVQAWSAAAEQFSRWVFIKGKVSEGLRRRRGIECELFTTVRSRLEIKPRWTKDVGRPQVR